MADDIDPGPDSSAPHDFVAFNGAVYFAAHDGTTPQASQLWAATGSSTQPVASFTPAHTGPSTASYANPATITICGHVLFVADDGISGPAVWSTDATTAGTVMLANVSPTTFVLFTSAQGIQEVYFVGPSPSNNPALWETDGTVSGTSIVKSFSGNSSSSDYQQYLFNLTSSGGKLFFTSSGAAGSEELWVSDGTAAGTAVVKDFQSSNHLGADISRVTAAAGKVFFTATDGFSTDLWVSDGTATGTSVVYTINPSNAYYGSGFYDLTGTTGNLFFLAGNNINGIQLWSSDGTTTQRLTNFEGGFFESQGVVPLQFVAIGNQFYFAVFNDDTDAALWKSDGTPGNTVMVASAFPSGQPPGSDAVDLANLTAVNSTLFFTVNSSGVTQLWSSDGSPQGTNQMSPTSLAGDNFSDLASLVSLGNVLIFTADDGIHGDELWSSDGTANGTTLIDDIDPGIGSGIGGSILGVENDGLLYFAADDGTHGYEPWVTDGTQQGTEMIADVNPGPASSYPDLLAGVNGQILFYYNDGVHGTELWTASPGPGPVITPIQSQEVTVQQVLSLSVQATFSSDATPNLVYSLVNGPPAGTTINASSGDFTWQPAATGVFTIAVRVTDTNQQGDPSTTETFAVVVNPAAANQVGIASPPLNVLAGSRGQVTLQLEDQYGNAGATSTAQQTINLISTSSSGMFYASQTSTTPLTSVVLATGESRAVFFYSDTQAGNPTLTVSDTAPALRPCRRRPSPPLLCSSQLSRRTRSRPDTASDWSSPPRTTLVTWI